MAVENNSEAYHVPIGHPGLQRHLWHRATASRLLGNGTSRGGGQPCVEPSEQVDVERTRNI